MFSLPDSIRGPRCRISHRGLRSSASPGRSNCFLPPAYTLAAPSVQAGTSTSTACYYALPWAGYAPKKKTECSSRIRFPNETAGATLSPPNAWVFPATVPRSSGSHELFARSGSTGLFTSSLCCTMT